MTFDTTPVPVPVGDCRCPGAPHGDGDVVYLAANISTAGGMSARVAMAQVLNGELDSITFQEVIARIWLKHGIVDWTFVDDDGDPVPVSIEQAERLLPYGKGGMLVADKADDLYAADVTDPLAEAVRTATAAMEKARRSGRSKAGRTSRTKASSSTPTSTTTQP
jgi:hypothetical protein